MRLFAVTTATVCLPVTALAQDLVLTGGSVIDVRTSAVQVASVQVRDGIIEAVAPTLTPRPGAAMVDARDHWVIPGLVELHTHTTDAATRRRALALGVTSTLTIYTGGEFVPPLGRVHRTFPSDWPETAP